MDVGTSHLELSETWDNNFAAQTYNRKHPTAMFWGILAQNKPGPQPWDDTGATLLEGNLAGMLLFLAGQKSANLVDIFCFRERRRGHYKRGI